MEEKTLALDEKVSAALNEVMAIIKNPDNLHFGDSSSLYSIVIEQLSDGTRNTPEQLEYLAAYEKALAVFKSASLELRKEMDILTLEKRASNRKKPGSADPLESRIRDAVMFSNRYGLFIAGHIGLNLLNMNKDGNTELKKQFEDYESVQDHEQVARYLAVSSRDHVGSMLEKKKAEGSKLSDDDLKFFLGNLFTSWINQFKWQTFKDIAESFGMDEITVSYGNCSVKAGEFASRSSLIRVDEKIKNVRLDEIVNSKDFVNKLKSSVERLFWYDFETETNVASPPFVIFTYGSPGGGKTIIAQAVMRYAIDLAKQHSIPLWALTHSPVDYASHYQNLTAIQLNGIADEIRNFPGLAVMYVADAHHVFVSQSDPDLKQEQRQTLSVYYKMFDGTLIPKNGRVMVIMDANYIENIDEATRSRVFDMILELPRFSRPEDFADLVKMMLVKASHGTVSLKDSDWLEIGKYVLDSEFRFSNREITHVLGEVARAYEAPVALIGAPLNEKIEFVKGQLSGLNKDNIISEFEKYARTRMLLDRESAEEMMRERGRAMMGAYLLPARGDFEASSR